MRQLIKKFRYHLSSRWHRKRRDGVAQPCSPDRAEQERPRPQQSEAERLRCLNVYIHQLEEEMAQETFESEVMKALAAQGQLINTVSTQVENLTNTLTNLNSTLAALEAALPAGGTGGSAGGPTNADVLEAVKTVDTAVTAVAANVVQVLAEVTPQAVTGSADQTAAKQA